jgi:hypothetical protein
MVASFLQRLNSHLLSSLFFFLSALFKKKASCMMTVDYTIGCVYLTSTPRNAAGMKIQIIHGCIHARQRPPAHIRRLILCHPA